MRKKRRENGLASNWGYFMLILFCDPFPDYSMDPVMDYDACANG